MRVKKAARLADYQGKRVYRFPVVVQLNDSRQMATIAEHEHEIISHTAAAAADCVRAMYATRAETEITVYGPKGGKAAGRYIGWHSAICNQLDANREPRARQLTLTEENVNDKKPTAPERCTKCGRHVSTCDSWTLWPWPDGAQLCDSCNDDRHETEEYDSVEPKN